MLPEKKEALLFCYIQPQILEVDVFFLFFCELYQSSPRYFPRISTSSAVLFRCHNLACLVAESLHASTASKKHSGFTIWSWILFYKRHWRKEQLLLLQAMQPFRGYTAKSKWWTVNSLAEMALQRIISLAVDHGWLYATNAFSLFMWASSLCTHACRHGRMHMHRYTQTQNTDTHTQTASSPNLFFGSIQWNIWD